MKDSDKKKGLARHLENVPEKEERRFSKAQLKAAERFSNRRDILEALLSDNTEYSAEEAEIIIKKFMKGQVK